MGEANKDFGSTIASVVVQLSESTLAPAKSNLFRLFALDFDRRGRNLCDLFKVRILCQFDILLRRSGSAESPSHPLFQVLNVLHFV